ncbi:MAG: ABC transporter ATP-binding protein [Desulfovibrionaceae bacterium]|nr:ABC transporter ATP-binding protein [Desulfovibrionaceae bacterium]MBF0513027.1 ABC transporter ATP-binding protein [Desulfovibrionaceae bacterium]
MSALYAARNLARRYGERVALRLLEFTVARGEAVAVTGANGAGKSTLLRLLAFLDEPDEGAIVFYGDPGLEKRRQATLLLQEPYLFKRTVFENVVFGLRARGQTRDLAAKAAGALAVVGLDYAAFAKREWFELSGGEIKRVALAARLVLDPLALLLDEPTANLDAPSAEAVRRAVQVAKDRGAAVIAASHDRDWLGGLFDREIALG